MHRRLLARFVLAAAALAGVPAVPAAGLQVTPIMLEIGREDASTLLWLSNTGPRALQAQVRVFRWTQVDQDDRLVASGDLLASPPMLDVPAGGRQLVRIVRAPGLARAAGEQSFRVIVDELPGGGDAPGEAAAGPGVQFLLRYSIPVFIAPEAGGPAQPQLAWRWVAAPPALDVVNTGSARAQLSEVELEDASGAKIVLSRGLLGYVLAGSRMRWRLPVDGPVPATVRVRARVNGEWLERTITHAGDDR
ncbi:fimbrial biogenesis chaperone [Dokdonella koreensis]|uniref:P pilus assembly protein chaperone PapD-like protein n=1 Tax=Dokdonella koreensis DS-123 TaxID=1300342 RepID=A0A161HRY7_9GAMM|nr:molecular chaperone [Dokdonella koreensis]ANB19757.1 P pilus assembly protein chaperone PapD-like protein [Dokdonella koreensis DS-123]